MPWLAPAGLQGGVKLEAPHQSRQPQSLSVALSVLGLRFALSQGVAASFRPTVAAAVLSVFGDVAASLWPAVAAAAILRPCGVTLQLQRNSFTGLADWKHARG